MKENTAYVKIDISQLTAEQLTGINLRGLTSEQLEAVDFNKISTERLAEIDYEKISPEKLLVLLEEDRHVEAFLDFALDKPETLESILFNFKNENIFIRLFLCCAKDVCYGKIDNIPKIQIKNAIILSKFVKEENVNYFKNIRLLTNIFKFNLERFFSYFDIKEYILDALDHFGQNEADKQLLYIYLLLHSHNSETIAYSENFLGDRIKGFKVRFDNLDCKSEFINELHPLPHYTNTFEFDNTDYKELSTIDFVIADSLYFFYSKSNLINKYFDKDSITYIHDIIYNKVILDSFQIQSSSICQHMIRSEAIDLDNSFESKDELLEQWRIKSKSVVLNDTFSRNHFIGFEHLFNQALNSGNLEQKDYLLKRINWFIDQSDSTYSYIPKG
jgi:hypothetical protein